jgi:hypothetical protein
VEAWLEGAPGVDLGSRASVSRITSSGKPRPTRPGPPRRRANTEGRIESGLAHGVVTRTRASAQRSTIRRRSRRAGSYRAEYSKSSEWFARAAENLCAFDLTRASRAVKRSTESDGSGCEITYLMNPSRPMRSSTIDFCVRRALDEQDAG